MNTGKGGCAEPHQGICSDHGGRVCAWPRTWPPPVPSRACGRPGLLGHPRDWPGESSHPQLLRHPNVHSGEKNAEKLLAPGETRTPNCAGADLGRLEGGDAAWTQ
jgi:hypothetical protein